MESTLVVLHRWRCCSSCGSVLCE